MAVLTTDILITGVRRNDVFEWLSESEKHLHFLQAGFPEARSDGSMLWLPFSGGFKTRELGYQFLRPDDSHGGRRVLVQTYGKRTSGTLNFSLRTMKPSSNTLVTLHMDYRTGTVLAPVLSASIEEELLRCFNLVLEAIQQQIAQELG